MASVLMVETSAWRRRRRAEFCTAVRRTASERLKAGRLQSASRGSLATLCAVGVAFMVIEAGLEAFSPGRVAAHDGHGRLAEGKRAF